jgi:hypothetical protein
LLRSRCRRGCGCRLAGCGSAGLGPGLQLLRELIPNLACVAVLASTLATDPFSGPFVDDLRSAATSAGLRLEPHLKEAYGADARDRYWEILEALRSELGYVDYLGALEPFRVEAMHRPDVLRMSSWLVDYPFADRLYPAAWRQLGEILKPVRGPAVILSDGDAVFQPRKVERSGLWRAVDDRVLIYIHNGASARELPQDPSNRAIQQATLRRDIAISLGLVGH